MESGKPRVLVIDPDDAHDNPLARTVSRDYTLVAVGQPFEALALVQSGSRYAAIVCDLEMPALAGPQLHDRIRQIDKAQAGRMIFVSRGHEHPRVRSFAETAGVHVLPRQPSREVLCAAIAEAAKT
ncbi:MAG: response regulator [Polyangiales bacterium]